jgi:catechol 2,3-dioxygenase-like lactoylglutathione lyase family enzyme
MVRAIYAGVVAADLEKERAWYEAVFGRPPDAAPMDGLYEWHLGANFLQLVALSKVRITQQTPEWGARGMSSVTLVVDDADAARTAAVRAGGTRVSEFSNDGFRTMSVADVEGNLVTFLQRF